MNRILAVALLVALAGCAGIVQQPADPAVTARIVAACTQSGMFKMASGLALSAVPAGPLASAVINAGVDRVCADPASFSADISTVEWVVMNLRG